MGRQGKNTLNTTKSNMTPIKTSSPTTARLEQQNIDEAQENDLKNSFRRMFEALKEEMKKFPQRNRGKDKQKNWKKSTNPLKKTKKKQSSR